MSASVAASGTTAPMVKDQSATVPMIVLPRRKKMTKREQFYFCYRLFRKTGSYQNNQYRALAAGQAVTGRKVGWNGKAVALEVQEDASD